MICPECGWDAQPDGDEFCVRCGWVSEPDSIDVNEDSDGEELDCL